MCALVKFMGGAKKKRAEDHMSLSDAEDSLAVTNEQMVTDMRTPGNTNSWLMEVNAWGDRAYECLQVQGFNVELGEALI